MFYANEDEYDESGSDLSGSEQSGDSEGNESEGEGRDSEERFDVESDDDYAAAICDVIKRYSNNPVNLTTFATGGEFGVDVSIPVVHVEGVGRLSYPLSKEQAVPLRSVSSQAPFGKGTDTVVDVDVRRAWQIDSSLVRINPHWLTNSLPMLVNTCCAKLGIDAARMGVRANLYKMLLYEEGGHFKKHRDTEKEPGMFGSLLIQLPAEHEGGHLTVEHDRQTKRFPFDKDSSDKAYYTAFYADCEHTLEPVTKGLRLVLAFNLVRCATVVAPSATLAPLSPASSAHRRDYEEMLAAAQRDWQADLAAVPKFALPLAHKYTRTNVSFAGLKGSDLSAATLLQNAAHPSTGEKLFRVYLALVTKVEAGTSDDDHETSKHYRRHAPAMSDDCTVTTSFRTESWVDSSGAIDFGNLGVDFNREIITARSVTETNEDEHENVVPEGMFGSVPDETKNEGYMGNYAGTLEYWYHSAVLVFWPADRDFEMRLAANPALAVEFLQCIERGSNEYTAKLQQLLCVLYDGGARMNTWQPSALLSLTEIVGQVRVVFGLCKRRGLWLNDQMAVTSKMSEYGWNALGESFTTLYKSQTPAVMVSLLCLLAQRCGVSTGANIATSASSTTTTTSTTSTTSSNTTSATTSATAVPLTAWAELLRVLVSKITTVQCAVTTADEWVTVSHFVVTHCQQEDQVAVAAHLGTTLPLHSLNHLLAELQHPAGGVSDGSFQAKLRACAVQMCIDTAPAAHDLVAVVDWVVRGQHLPMLVSLRATLQKQVTGTELCRMLFTLPSVLQELKSTSPLSTELHSLVQARVDALQPHTAAPTFSWRMPADSIFSSQPERVGPFLASEDQTRAITGGFNDIGHARNWADKYFNRVACGVSAVASGQGQRATVTLTKHPSVHTAVVKRCEENKEELRGLRKLLRARDRDGDDDVGGKRARVQEREYCVID